MNDFLGVILSIFFGFAPMLLFAYIIYWLDRYEKEPLVLLGLVFSWGAVVAAGAAFIINTTLGLGIFVITGSDLVTEFSTASFIAPFIEESLKGLAVMVIFLIFRREFDSTLDGIVYAAVTALGFAATENAYYIYSYGYAEEGFSGLWVLVFVRVILVGWQHPFYTAFIGIGLAAARLSRSTLVKLTGPLLGFIMAIFLHSMHNTLAGLISGLGWLLLTTFLDWSGWVFMLLFIIWAVSQEQRRIVVQLREEVALGIITPAQYRVACSALAQSGARANSLFAGGYGSTSRFYQLTAELAHKKHQRVSIGEEDGNSRIIANLRAELAQLSRMVPA